MTIIFCHVIKRERSLFVGFDNLKTNTFNKLPEKRQIEILDAAAGVFAKKGYFQAGIDEICQAAGISNGSLYKYFKNKKGLFVTVAHRSIDLLQITASRMAAEQLDFWQKMQRILKEVNPFLALNKDYFIVYMDLGSPAMDDFAAELSDTFERQSFEYFNDLIKEAQEKGEIREGIAVETAAYFLDNHLMMYAFSCVSEHYDRRFHQFFGKGNEKMDDECKIEMIMRSYRQLLE